MQHRPSPSLSLALVRGQAIFLDCEADRYFALPAPDNALLLDLLCGADIGCEAQHRLTAAIGVNANRDFLLSMRAVPPRTGARADVAIASPRLTWRDLLDAITERVTASLFLRFFGLQHSLDRIARARRLRHPRFDDLDRITAAQRWLDQHVTAADACLTRSLALVRCAVAKGCDVQLVIGVKIDPFGAHCWAQAGAFILNDDVDRVAPFTPIIVLP